jgi:hypothetical protein
MQTVYNSNQSMPPKKRVGRDSSGDLTPCHFCDGCRWECSLCEECKPKVINNGGVYDCEKCDEEITICTKCKKSPHALPCVFCDTYICEDNVPDCNWACQYHKCKTAKYASGCAATSYEKRPKGQKYWKAKSKCHEWVVCKCEDMFCCKECFEAHLGTCKHKNRDRDAYMKKLVGERSEDTDE